MADYDERSRFRDADTYSFTDADGTTVAVVEAPARPDAVVRGYHLRTGTTGLDALAQRYLDDASGYWRICELNDAVYPDTLLELERVAIPERS